MSKRTIEIKVRLNRKEADALEKKVRKSQLSREAYLRHLIHGMVPREAPPPDYYAMMRELSRVGNALEQLNRNTPTQQHDAAVLAAETAVREIPKRWSCRSLWGSKAVATTSLWRVKGQISKVVNYAVDASKTEQSEDLRQVIGYAMQQSKTAEDTAVLRQFVTGINCHTSTAVAEMTAVKKRFGKEDGTIAYHGYQSFAPGEATPELVHEIGVKLARQLWGGAVSSGGGDPPGQGKSPAFPLCLKHGILRGREEIPPYKGGLL